MYILIIYKYRRSYTHGWIGNLIYIVANMSAATTKLLLLLFVFSFQIGPLLDLLAVDCSCLSALPWPAVTRSLMMNHQQSLLVVCLFHYLFTTACAFHINSYVLRVFSFSPSFSIHVIFRCFANWCCLAFRCCLRSFFRRKMFRVRYTQWVIVFALIQKQLLLVKRYYIS